MTERTSAWLTIAAGGGKWSVAEVQRALPQENRRMVDKSVRAMAELGLLTEFPGTPTTYGVTPQCKVPRGVRVAEILEAMRP